MSRWLLRVLLRLLPDEDRVRFGDDLVRDSQALRAEERRRHGRVAEFRYLVRELSSLIRLARETRRRAFGDTGHRSAWRVDAFAAWRRLRRHPWRSVGACLLLTAALSAALVAYAMADAVLWRPMPFQDADRLVAVWENTGTRDAAMPARLSGSRAVDWMTRATVFDGLAAFGAAGFQVEAADGVATVRGVRASGHFFEVLGVTPALGRLFSRADQAPGAAPVVVLAHNYWRVQLGGRPTVIGETLRLSGRAYTIIGVLPDIWLPSWPVNPATIQLDSAHRQLWVPLAAETTLAQNTRSHLLGAIGRLAPGETPESARRHLESLAAPDLPDPHGGVVRPLRMQMVGQVRTPLLLLLGAACCVFLVACLNLAAIDLASFDARLSEFRVRAALGAGASALTRQLCAEVAPVALAASLLSLIVAHSALIAVAASLDTRVPLLTPPALDGTAVGLLIMMAMLVVIVMTAWPLLRVRALTRLHDHGAARVVPARPGVFRALVVGQVTGAVTLVLSSIALLDAFLVIGDRDPGFDPQHVYMLEISLPRDRYQTTDAIVATERQLQDVLAGAPGIRSATVSHDHPFEANWLDIVTVRGDVRGDDARSQVQLRIVGPAYVEAMGARLLEGHTFDPLIDPTDAGVVLVNEAFVRQMGAGVGRQVALSSPAGTWGEAVPASFTIAGVLQDERFRGLELASEPAVYVTTRQFPQTDLTILVRYADSALAQRAALPALIRRVEPRASLGTVRSLSEVDAAQRGPRTLMTTVITGFASGALLLAGAGLYGMLMLRVAAQQREIGIRMALGATPARIAQQVGWQAAVPVIIGTVCGLALALAGVRGLRTLVGDVASAAPGAVLLVVAVVVTTGVLAAMPAVRRAGRTNPTSLLRS